MNVQQQPRETLESRASDIREELGEDLNLDLPFDPIPRAKRLRFDTYAWFS